MKRNFKQIINLKNAMTNRVFYHGNILIFFVLFEYIIQRFLSFKMEPIYL